MAMRVSVFVLVYLAASAGCSRAGSDRAATTKKPSAAVVSESAPAESRAAPMRVPVPVPVPVPDNTLHLGAFSEADAQRAAARSGEVDPRVTWRIRQWSARPDTLLALSFVALDADDPNMRIARLQPEVAVLEKHGAELQRVAAGPVPIDADSCVCGEPAGGCGAAPSVDFDYARYRIAIATEREAFGVRLKCSWTAPAGEGDSTRLTLFELEAGQLREVFSGEVASDSSDRVCGCTLGSQTTLQILSSQHNGFFDLRLQTRYRKTPFFDDVPLTEPAPAPSSQRFTWNGTRYADTARAE